MTGAGPKCKPEFLDLKSEDVRNLEKFRAAIDQYFITELRTYGKWKDINDFCNSVTFDSEDTIYKLPEKCKDIPLTRFIQKGQQQFVLGRVSTLKTLKYNFCSKFICLSLPYRRVSNSSGSNRLAWSIKLNDIFILCGSMKNATFPIRLVLDERITIDDLSSMQFTKKQIRATAFQDTSILPASLNKDNLESVTLREICQLSYIYKMHMYQSIEHPNIFFFSKSSRQQSKELQKIF